MATSVVPTTRRTTPCCPPRRSSISQSNWLHMVPCSFIIVFLFFVYINTSLPFPDQPIRAEGMHKIAAQLFCCIVPWLFFIGLGRFKPSISVFQSLWETFTFSCIRSIKNSVWSLLAVSQNGENGVSSCQVRHYTS